MNGFEISVVAIPLAITAAMYAYLLHERKKLQDAKRAKRG